MLSAAGMHSPGRAYSEILSASSVLKVGCKPCAVTDSKRPLLQGVPVSQLSYVSCSIPAGSSSTQLQIMQDALPSRELMCCPLGIAGKWHLQQMLQSPRVCGAQMSRSGRHQLAAAQQQLVQRLVRPCRQQVVRPAQALLLYRQVNIKPGCSCGHSM